MVYKERGGGEGEEEWEERVDIVMPPLPERAFTSE